MILYTKNTEYTRRRQNDCNVHAHQRILVDEVHGNVRVRVQRKEEAVALRGVVDVLCDHGRDAAAHLHPLHEVRMPRVPHFAAPVEKDGDLGRGRGR